MATEVFPPFVSHDPPHPGTEVPGHVESSEVLPGHHKRVLDEIGAGGSVSRQGSGVSKQTTVMITDQNAEGMAIQS